MLSDNKTTKTLFFKTQDDFRKWLESNHEKETELIVGFYKVNSGKPSMKSKCHVLGKEEIGVY